MTDMLETMGGLLALAVTAGIAVKAYDHITESLEKTEKNTRKRTRKNLAKNKDNYKKKLIYG